MGKEKVLLERVNEETEKPDFGELLLQSKGKDDEDGKRTLAVSNKKLVCKMMN